MTRRILPSVTGLLLVICAGVHADERPLLGDVNELHSIAAAVNADRIEADIRTLVSFGTRHTLSDTRSDHRGIGAARRWIEAEFQRTSTACGGCLTVLTQSDVVSGPRIPEPAEVVNVLAIQRGVSDPDRYVVMSGDIDSRVSDPLDGESDSPGANDNASGMAGALEAARVLSRYRFAASIIYVGLSGEEQGLYGGEIMARRAREAGWRIEAVLNNDMIGNIEGINGVIDNATARVFSEGTRVVESAEEATRRRFTGGEVDSALAQSRPLCGSDGRRLHSQSRRHDDLSTRSLRSGRAPPSLQRRRIPWRCASWRPTSTTTVSIRISGSRMASPMAM